MPKEKINRPRDYRRLVPESGTVLYESPVMTADNSIPDDESGPISQTGPVIQVGWHRDHWVQVSIEGDRSYFEFAANNPDGDTSDRSTVYSEPLTRDELNKLIRSLRRARDQVFGRDE